MKPKTTDREISKEVRFAVVMYGGVSLAIYINGVVQELFRMVRATAADPDKGEEFLLLPEKELSGTERVYRQLGRMLGREGEEKAKPLGPKDPVRTSFVVDILSGSSAGGINAVYLAKALANGQDIGQLSKLWIDEGDIAKLINDKGSRLAGLKPQKPPRSLLNGQRMYRKLLDAFDGMEEGKKSEEKAKSPYVEELDLFVTATDFYGLPVPLRLLGKVVEEHRYRNVYHLRYSNAGKKVYNDFLAENNPFLAFVARSTSAFPFAFDPIRLLDTGDILKTMPAYRNQQFDWNRWQKFFPAYRRPDYGPPFNKRAFVDGGYLDNKPFSYAIDALASRSSRVPVDRKLIYVEPSPEHIEDQTKEVPNAIENTAAALSSLPRYEPIREDLQRILHRNRLVERVESITSNMAEDVRYGELREKPVREERFGEQDLKKMIEVEGVAYGGYHRLKVDAVSDDIVGMIACASEFDVESDEFFAIRYLVQAWRKSNYTAYLDNDRGKMTENEFLVRYDLSYRIRRLNFVLNRIEQLYYSDPKAEELLEQRGFAVPRTKEEEETFRDKLTELRHELGVVLSYLQQTREELKKSGSENPLATAIKGTRLDRHKLLQLLEKPADERRKKAEDLVSGEMKEGFRELASALADYIEKSTKRAADDCRRILGSPRSDEGSRSFAARAKGRAQRFLCPPGSGESPQRFDDIAKNVVRDYYDSYDRYDLISFPILYATEVGEETDPTEVIRISPEDAPSLIDERDENEQRRKLAGVALRGFGAFLDRGWRRNDILWGRLDGAERIITTLLYDKPEFSAEERERLIREAQLAILAEEFEIPDRDRLLQLLADAIARTDPTDQSEKKLRKLVERDRHSSIESAIQSALRSSLEREALLAFVDDSYEVNREIDPKGAARVLSRSTQVSGEMFEGIAKEYGRGSGLAVWLARLGRAFSGLTEVSVRGSIPNLIWRHWLVLLYAFEVVLIVIGAVFSREQAYQAGLTAFGITALVHIGTLGLGDYMRRRKRWWGVPFVVLLLVILLLAALGVYHLVYYAPDVIHDAALSAWRHLRNVLPASR